MQLSPSRTGTGNTQHPAKTEVLRHQMTRAKLIQNENKATTDVPYKEMSLPSD